uniref:P-type domain-containing protein n=1 Tax=Cyprinus carpio carpio TaxID=630221 RepID=A0A8C1F4G6_CYPCA
QKSCTAFFFFFTIVLSLGRPLHSERCSISDNQRVSCGTSGITQDECLATGCCFDERTSISVHTATVQLQLKLSSESILMYQWSFSLKKVYPCLSVLI